MEISSDLLRSYLALCQLRSFTKAAKKLHKSQSALSAQIANLEERVGLKLFDRSERPLSLTEAGEKFLSFAVELSNRIGELDEQMKELASGVAGEVKIAASTSVGTHLLPRLVAEILRDFPKLRITISAYVRRQACDAVRRADQHFGIILADEPAEGLIAKPLKKASLCLVISSKHPLANNKIVDLNNLKHIPFITGMGGGDWTNMVAAMLTHKGVSELAVPLRLNSYQAIKEAVIAGLGVALLPDFSVERDLRDKTLCQLDVKNAHFSATIMSIERKDQVFSPTMATVKTLLEKKLRH